MVDNQPDADGVNLNRDRDRWKAFVTQTDWSGPVMKESWYGHGNTCNRIAMFIHLSALCSTIVLAFHGFQRWPILHPFLTFKDLDKMKHSHEECLTAICQAVEHIQFDCQMTAERRIVMSHVSIDRVPLPFECHHAIRLTFGEDFEQDLLTQKNVEPFQSEKMMEKREIDLLHFQDMTNDETGSSNIPIFQFLPEECLVQESLLEYLFLGDIFWGPTSGAILIDLVDTLAMQPGDREQIKLRQYACPRHMSLLARTEILPRTKEVYKLFLTWRRSAAVCFMYWVNMAYFSAMCSTRIFFLLIPSFFLWLLMPKDEIRGKRISLFSIISTLLLLTTLVDEGSGKADEIIRTGIVVTGALSFGNEKAAIEWCFLFLLSFMEVGSISESCEDAIHQVFLHLDPSEKVLSWIEFLVSNFIPGFGLWKVVVLYAVYMSFPSKRPNEHIKRD